MGHGMLGVWKGQIHWKQ